MAEPTYLIPIATYYESKLLQYGPTPKGVDWRDSASQQLRFAQLVPLLDAHNDRSIVDVGCGYGAFLDYLRACGHANEYLGLDISNAMVAAARRLHQDAAARFEQGTLGPLPAVWRAGYAVASGIFNIRLQADNAEWQGRILETLESMDSHCRNGFAFNCLSLRSDPEKRRTSLYYGDPEFFAGYCRERFSREVELLENYGLYEFTLLIRKPHEGDGRQ